MQRKPVKRYKWDEEKIAILVAEYKFADIDKLAEKLGCKLISTIYNKAFQLGLKRGQLTNRRRNSKHDIKWLEKNYRHYSNKTLAIYLGTSVRYVKKLAIKFNLHKDYIEPYTKEKDNLCRESWRKRNPEKVREYNQRYREKLKAKQLLTT